MRTHDAGAKDYSIIARNRPGELAKLTKYLLDSGTPVSDLLVVNGGDRASIRFTTAKGADIRDGLRKTGLRFE